jgi:hypothetical protein
MDTYEKSLLSDFKVYCPKYIIQKYNHKHAAGDNWTRFYYYKRKKRYAVPPCNVDFDYEVSSTLAYNKSVFYKMSTMSNSDTFFDYYFKLKPELPKIVIKSSNRKTKNQLNKICFPAADNHQFSSDGKILVKFE